MQIFPPGEPWYCGLCDGYESRGEDTEATDKTPGDSMTSSQNTCGQWNSTASGGKKKLTNVRGLQEVVQQEKASLVDIKPLQTAFQSGIDRFASGETGEASRKSKLGRPLKNASPALPSKRRRADSGISKAKPDDGNASSSVLEQAGDAEEVAVESRREPVGATCSFSIDLPANAGTTPSEVDEGVLPAVVPTESNNGQIQNVEGRAGLKEGQLDDTKLANSDKVLQSMAMKDTESSTEAALGPVTDMSTVQVVKSEEMDASHAGIFKLDNFLFVNFPLCFW